MKIRLSDLRRIIGETVAETMVSKDSPLTVWPKVGPSGDLMWIVKDSVQTAVIDTSSGEVHGNFTGGSDVFAAVVGALQEWYAVDRESYDGENIEKVKAELNSYIDREGMIR